MVWLSIGFQYGTIPAGEQCCDATVPDELQYSSYSNRHQARPNSATVPDLQYSSATVPAHTVPTRLLQYQPDTVPMGCYNHPPLGLDVPVEYQTNLNTIRISSLGHVPYV